jgi:hypothetical protein
MNARFEIRLISLTAEQLQKEKCLSNSLTV